jgi:hypothetical protein
LLDIEKGTDRSRCLSLQELDYLTEAFSLLPADTFTVFEAAIWMVAPV